MDGASHIPGFLQRTFSSLRNRNFRLLWIGNVVSVSGDWMDQIAFNWLVLVVTNSPLSLGLVNLCRAIPMMLLVPLGGVAADKWERRRILMTTQSTAMVLAFILGGLVTTGLVNIWEIYLIAVLRGAVMSFNLPARESILNDLVPKDGLQNAIALSSATRNLSRVLGPSLGGILIALLGVDWLFYINGLSFLAILQTLHLLKGITTSGGHAKSGALQELKEGFIYLKGNKLLRYLVFLAVIPMFFGQPYMTMLTVFARDVLRIGPAGLGLLTSTTALGSIVGSLIVAGRRKKPGIGYMLGGMIVFGVALLLFSFSPWVITSIFFLFLVGASNMTYNSTNNTLLQMNVPDAYRGRVLSMLFINRGLIPLGTSLTGLLTEIMGAPKALGTMSMILILLGAAAAIARPKSTSETV